MAESTQVQYRASDYLATWLTDTASISFEGDSVGLAARSAAEMWVTALSESLKVAAPLTVSEWSCVADVMNGTILSHAFGALIVAELSDAFAPDRLQRTNAYGDKWGIDEKRLVQWALNLGPVADYAVRRAMALWWNVDSSATAEGFAALGLPVAEDQ